MSQAECEWTDECEYYQTGCGHAFCFEAETLEESGFNFCPYCGKPIKEQKERENDRPNDAQL
jgi:hypothetical protein